MPKKHIANYFAEWMKRIEEALEHKMDKTDGEGLEERVSDLESKLEDVDFKLDDVEFKQEEVSEKVDGGTEGVHRPRGV
ncbi:MAG TPA: hypothetical protein VK902_02530 [Rubrobacter sp.]|jgi:hypothetical protein|nr:hypothetical protein [Rubrobacter sp.]